MAANPLTGALRPLALLAASAAGMAGLVLLVNAPRYGLAGALAGLLLLGGAAAAAIRGFRPAEPGPRDSLPAATQSETLADDEIS